MGRSALIAVDCQMDYGPGGVLEAHHDIDGIIERLVAVPADVVIATRDLHPPNHFSFKTQGGLWEPNCIKGTRGSNLFPEIREIADYVTTKGQASTRGGFSAFESKTLRPLRELEGILQDEQVTSVTIGGFLLEWCVSHSAFDANSISYDTTVKLSATGTLQSEYGIQESVARLEKAGVNVCQ